MNERIQKLALETDVWCDQNWAGHEFYNVRWEEKFAELIVRECADIFDGVYTDQRRPERIDKRIKQHFGVGE
jgi:hypothetical protein